MAVRLQAARVIMRAAVAKRRKRLRSRVGVHGIINKLGLSSLKTDLRLSVKDASDYLRSLYQKKRTSMRFYNATSKYYVQLLKFNFETKLPNVLDRHFIVAQFHNLATRTRAFEYMLLEQNPNLLKTVRSQMNEMEDEIGRFKTWKEIAVPKEDYEVNMKKKRKWVTKWTEKASKMLVAKAQKRAGRKK
jgi:hypothetical protein